MKADDIKTVYELMKDATHVQIIFIGFLVAPFAITAWFDLFDKIPFLGDHKLPTLIAVFIAFFAMLITAVVFDSRDKKKKLLLARITTYMAAHNYRIVRFSTIRSQLNIQESDIEFVALINTFPEKLCLAKASKKADDGSYVIDANGNEVIENAFRITAPPTQNSAPPPA
ncbi:hypothetical protein [Stutzerimonas nitrititolerans]|uniref:hypothetical protein n=1 Tax=Stutzerimonas nitrititolerans TaxID=2482751 RepID=UPI0028AA03A4|nr:hypothetical protein [Stutzerimonas nitrititolerans]